MNQADFEDVLLEQDDFGVLTVTLNRPEKLNALTPAIRRCLRELPEAVAKDDSVKAVLITGAGRGFCSGADMSSGAENPYPVGETRTGLEQTRYGWVASLRSVAKPLIAAINGPAVGGGLSIALACDVRFAAESATLGAAWIRRGLVPDMGATKLLTELLGPTRALRFIWAGEPIDAEAALGMGLVDEVMPAVELVPRATAYARALADGPSVAIDLSKRLVQFAANHSLEEATSMEELYQGFASRTKDVIEGRLAFQEKRAPRFTGF